MINKKIQRFFFPSLTRKFFTRLCLVAVAAYLFFNYICIPLRIRGCSMEPAYRNGGVNFCWRLCYIFSEPEKCDVVAVRLAGTNVMLLKRVVAVEGEIVEFRDGQLYVDGKEMHEPYVCYPCNWNLPPRRVEKDCVYVIGDNRNMPIENHSFGQTSVKRITGVALW